MCRKHVSGQTENQMTANYLKTLANNKLIKSLRRSRINSNKNRRKDWTIITDIKNTVTVINF